MLGPGAEDCSATVETGVTGAFSEHIEKFWKAQIPLLILNEPYGRVSTSMENKFYVSWHGSFATRMWEKCGIITKKNSTVRVHTECPTSSARSKGNLNDLRWLSSYLPFTLILFMENLFSPQCTTNNQSPKTLNNEIQMYWVNHWKSASSENSMGDHISEHKCPCTVCISSLVHRFAHAEI